MNMLGLGGGVDTKEVSFSVNEKTSFDDIYHLGGERQPVSIPSMHHSNPTGLDNLNATRRYLVTVVYAHATVV